MKLGYVRVSTEEQSIDLQVDALTRDGVTQIFTDRISGSNWERPGLTNLLAQAAAGDQIVVWKLDRLGRSTLRVLELIARLKERGIELRSITEGLDSATLAGQFVITVLAGLAEWERQTIRERTLAGLKAAAARGRKGGNRRKLNREQIRAFKELMSREDLTKKQKCERLGISSRTYYREARRIAEGVVEIGGLKIEI